MSRNNSTHAKAALAGHREVLDEMWALVVVEKRAGLREAFGVRRFPAALVQPQALQVALGGLYVD